MRKLFTSLLCFCLVFLCVVSVPANHVHAEDFEANEDHYFELCSSSDLDKENVNVCREFKNYLAKKQQSLQDQIKANNEKIDSLELELADIYEMLYEINDAIDTQNSKIAVLDAQIVQLEESIQKRDTQIRERMYVTQSMLNSNMYLEFLMGATSIDDFFSRMTSIDELMEYDQDLIKKLNEEKAEVEADRALLQEEKERLDELKSQQEALVNQISAQIDEITRETEHITDQTQEYQDEMKNISNAIEEALLNNGGFIEGPVSSGGFSCPVQWGIVTAANWRYPSGGLHLGMDIGGRSGSNLYAPCDGVVIYMATGCASNGGYYGNTCNGGAGNYLVMLSQMNGTTYAIKMYHMINDNYIGWSYGDFIPVYRGQVVGFLGHSGSSTGPHLHLEIINLGAVSYTEGAQMLSRYGTSFGLGFGTNGYNNRCAVKSAPCRENASELLGYSLYKEVGY